MGRFYIPRTELRQPVLRSDLHYIDTGASAPADHIPVNRPAISAAAVSAIGVAASFGHPAGIAAMALMPALTMSQTSRWPAWLTAFSYYAAAS
jgi:hypothetical protein